MGILLEAFRIYFFHISICLGRTGTYGLRLLTLPSGTT